ncbi:rhodanese-like domain-containing protein [Deinococcus sp.]|uniref:rhodanese-like domain-containing protein n=1 Tax=Deinococcus sp. TaxID=47478 RepID=UPI002600C1D9|nr:rhodanese-like domain-containing protein [Deinococcus sp.]
MLPPRHVLMIDLRSEALRLAQPLEALIPNRSCALSLEQIEAGEHGLSAEDGPLLVICERGVRSGLAARFLRADRLDAAAYIGGVLALLLALHP